MKKLLLTVMFVVTFFALSAVSASAVVNDTVKVGLRYGSSVLDAANLENYQGSGYAFGYFDADREFVELDWTDETTITMRPDGRGGIEVTETNSGRWFTPAMTAPWALCPWTGTPSPGSRATATGAALSIPVPAVGSRW